MKTPTELPIVVTQELMEKYDRPGPRYTSYPTAPEWSDFGEESYKKALQNASERVDTPLSLYFHIPFCYKRCLFCGCNVTISKKRSVAETYLDYLRREMDMVVERLGSRKKVAQLHWGGGTPTYLNVEEIRLLHGMISERFEILPDAEVALEVDPRVTTLEQITVLRQLGFNRISMGVQDLDPEVQRLITRDQTEEQTRELFGWCRDADFGGINIDLIYGLPGQNHEGWQQTVESMIDIRPDRMAVYSYAHLPSMLKHQKKLLESLLPSGGTKYQLFAEGRALFMEAGYAAIGMDHFALPTDELTVAMKERRLHRNFMGYTTVPASEMIGFGVSSIGEVGGAYAQNEKRLVKYYRMVDEGMIPTSHGMFLSEDDEIRRWLIRQLMCNFYVDVTVLKARFDVDYDTYFAPEEDLLQDFYEEGFIAREDGNLRVMPLGQVFIRNVSMVFDAYLKRPDAKRLFSRTV